MEYFNDDRIKELKEKFAELETEYKYVYTVWNYRTKQLKSLLEKYNLDKGNWGRSVFDIIVQEFERLKEQEGLK